MKKLVLMLTILLFCVGKVSAKEKSDCVGISYEPEVEFSTSYGQLRYDFSKNTKKISELAAQIGSAEHSAFLSGLATLTVENEYVLGTKALPVQNGYCVVPEVIQVYVGFSRPTIYISNELEKGSCQYNLVMLHEQTHQRINTAALDYFVPYFQFAAHKIGRELEPVYIEKLSLIDSATDDLTQIFTEKFDKVLLVFKKELAVEQGKLDNQSNYVMEDNICKNFNVKRFRRSPKGRQ